MFASALSLLAAAAYGVGDFFGATATRRSHPILVSFIGHIFYAVVALLGLLVFRGTWSTETCVWGVTTGASEALGFLVFYYALSVGNVALVAPLVSVVYASIPVLWGLGSGDSLNTVQILGLALGLVSVLALSIEKSTEEKASKNRLTYVLALSLVGGIMWGFSTVALSYAPKNSGMAPVFLAGLTAFFLLAITLLVTRRQVIPKLEISAIQPAIWSGVLFGVANLLIITALRFGSLTLVGLLTALYPLATVVLARLVYKEHITGLRWVGIGLAVLAASILSVG